MPQGTASLEPDENCVVLYFLFVFHIEMLTRSDVEAFSLAPFLTGGEGADVFMHSSKESFSLGPWHRESFSLGKHGTGEHQGGVRGGGIWQTDMLGFLVRNPKTFEHFRLRLGIFR